MSEMSYHCFRGELVPAIDEKSPEPSESDENIHNDGQLELGNVNAVLGILLYVHDMQSRKALLI